MQGGGTVSGLQLVAAIASNTCCARDGETQPGWNHHQGQSGQRQSAQPAHQPGQPGRARLGKRRQRRQIAIGPGREGAHVDDVVGFVVGDDQHPAVAHRRAQDALELGEIVADATQRVAGVRVAEANVEPAIDRPQLGDPADVGDQQPGDRRGGRVDLEVARLAQLA
jgi:hypothetical protein